VHLDNQRDRLNTSGQHWWIVMVVLDD